MQWGQSWVTTAYIRWVFQEPIFQGFFLFIHPFLASIFSCMLILLEKKNTTKTTWAVTWQNQQSDCVPSEDSDQPWHPPSLIRVFAVPMKKAWVLSYPLSAQRRLWSAHSKDSDHTGRLPRLIWVFAGCTHILLVLSCRGSHVTTTLHQNRTYLKQFSL